MIKKHLFTLTLCCLVAATAPVGGADDWQSLFDGRTLGGWVPRIEPVRPDTRPEAERVAKPTPSHLLPEDKRGKAKFYVEDGAIVGHAENHSIHSYLCTEREFDNFEFECETFVGWPATKMDGMNSGIQIRSKWDETKPVYGRMGGVQVDIDGKAVPGTTGALYGQGIKLDAAYPKALPKNDQYKLDEWNHLRIVAQGAKIQTWVNGQPVTDVELPEAAAKQPKGFLGLQVHEVMSEKPAEVRWRNIRIRELPVQGKE